MKRLVKPLLYLVAVIILSIYLVPKTNLYYMFEKKLLQYDMVFSNEKIEENFLSLELNKFDVYYKKQFVLNVENLKTSYDVLTPFELHVDAKGEFGTLYCNIDLKAQKAIFALKASAWMKNNHVQVLNAMNLTKGVYTYEFNY